MNKPASPNYPIHDLMLSRWSPRAFTDQELGREQVATVLEAARWAASCFNEQPWRYIVAMRADRDAFARLLGVLVPKNQLWAQHAAALMISVASLQFAHNQKENPYAAHDTGQASAHMALQATSMGFAIHQMGGFDKDRAREVLGIPADHAPIAAIALGYPGDPALLPEELRAAEVAPRTRKPLEAMVMDGVFGTPFTTDAAKRS